jgi:Tryptophanyl-tRNA synthetase
MGKSLGNAIYLSDDAETVTAKVKSAFTDTNRIAISDKGNPSICMVNTYHKVFNPAEHNNICDMCRNAKIGCVACKKQLAAQLNTMLEPIRVKRAYYSGRKGEIRDYIISGSRKANQIGNQTMEKVKAAMKMKL